MEHAFIYAQCAGLFALFIEMIRFQMKSARNFFLLEPALATLYTLQFYLLNAPAAILINAIGILRGFCGISLSQQSMQKCIIGIFLPAYAIVTALIYDDILDILPAAALFCSSIAFMIQNNRYLVVRLYLVNTLIWFIYSIYYDAFAHILTCLFVAASLVIGIIRHEEFYREKFNFVFTRLPQKSPA